MHSNQPSLFDRADPQREALTAAGNVLVNAGPGTGKTYLIAEKTARLVTEGARPQRILVLTFSRRAAAELRRRISATTACEIRTFHGFASRLLEADGPRFATRRLLGAFADALLFERAVNAATLATFDRATQRSEGFRADAARFAADLRRSGRAGLAALRATATPRLADLSRIADVAAKLRERTRASDLNDLIALAVESLEQPTSPQSRWLSGRYDHVLIDEFQDIDRQQLTLCERIGGRVFAVGDPAQSIYRFRGAVHGIFEEGARRLGLRTFALRNSHRCPQIVCDLAALTPLVGATKLESVTGRPGSISVRAARTTLDEVAMIADAVEDAMGRGLAPESIAVLVRAMRPVGTALVAELRARRIAVATGGSEAFFSDPNVAVVRLALRALAAPGDASRWIALLCAPHFGYDALALRLGLAGASIASGADALAWLARSGLTGSLATAEFGETLDGAAAAFETSDLGGATRRLVRGFGVLERLAADPDVAAARTSIARIARLIDALGEAQRSLLAIEAPAGSAALVAAIDEHVDDLGTDETPPDDARGVRVLTIHGAKGLEFDFVVIADAVDGRLPAAARPTTLLGDADRTVLDDAGIDCVDARADDGAVEEASLWYVAVTRTKGALLVTYAMQGSDGGPQRVTRFLPVSLHVPAGVPIFERSRLRFELALLGSRDLAAIAALDALAHDSPIVAALRDSGEAAFADLEARPVVIDRTQGVGAAGTWIDCPRRFYYQNALGLRDESTIDMERGTAMHAVLARFHHEVATFGPGDVAAAPRWTQRLRELREAVWADFAFTPESLRLATGALADRQLARYAVALAGEAAHRPFAVVGIEYDIDVVTPSGTLRGRIDRIDRAGDGTLILRDYKTGKAKPAFAKALVKITKDDGPAAGRIAHGLNPQLALYRRGAERAFAATVARLDYLYLKGDRNGEPGTVCDATPIDERTRPLLETLETFVDTSFVAALKTGLEVPKTEDESACTFCTFALARLCEGAGIGT